jgi:aminopeptidase-like protein
MNLEKQKRVYEALCEHFNIEFESGDNLLFPDSDGYEDEWVIFGKDIEILEKNKALRNEMEMLDDPKDAVGLYNILQGDRIGAYKRLCNSNYYFRWF